MLRCAAAAVPPRLARQCARGGRPSLLRAHPPLTRAPLPTPRLLPPAAAPTRAWRLPSSTRSSTLTALRSWRWVRGHLGCVVGQHTRGASPCLMPSCGTHAVWPALHPPHSGVDAHRVMPPPCPTPPLCAHPPHVTGTAGSTPHECQQFGWHTGDTVLAAYGSDGSKYWKRNNTKSSTPSPSWLTVGRLGQSAEQQVIELERELERAKEEEQGASAAVQVARAQAREADVAERAARKTLAGLKQEKVGGGGVGQGSSGEPLCLSPSSAPRPLIPDCLPHPCALPLPHSPSCACRSHTHPPLHTPACAAVPG